MIGNEYLLPVDKMMTKLIVLACLLAVAKARSVANLDISTLTSRIIGGENAKPGQFPHQVSFQARIPPKVPEFMHFCGGSILNDQWILTAAHCLVVLESADSSATIVIKAGKHDLSSTEDTEQTLIVTKAAFYIHEEYDRHPEYGVGPYDIGLIKLPKPLRLNKYVAKIDLPEKNSEPSGKVTLSGWGAINPDQDDMPYTLQTTNLEVVDRVSCNSAMKKLYEEAGKVLPIDLVDDTNVCTGPLTGGKSACGGDSGGPLISADSNGKTELVGIVSWGLTPCGLKGAPSVFARTSYFIDWINDIMEKHN